MRRPTATPAEVVLGGYQPAPEVSRPDPIDHDPGGQGILGTGQPSGQLEPATTVISAVQRIAAEDFEETAGNHFARLRRLAALLNPHVVRSTLRHAIGQLAVAKVDQGRKGLRTIVGPWRCERWIDRAYRSLPDRDVIDVDRRPDARDRTPAIDQDGVDRAIPPTREGPVHEPRHILRLADRARVCPAFEVEGKPDVVPRPGAKRPDRSRRIAVAREDVGRADKDLDGR